MLIDYRVCLVKINLQGFHNNVAPSVKVAYEFNLKDPLSNFSQVDIYRVFLCDGLLLCTTIDKKRLVVWNPCSGETKWIQPRNFYTENDGYALGYDNSCSCKRYKILRMVRGSNCTVSFTEYEIYDFTSDSWRVLSFTDQYLGSGYGGVSVKGNSYWIPRSDSLLSFDYSTERFQSLNLPHHFQLGSADLSVAREEQLCLLGSLLNYDEYNVWVTTSPGSAESWRKFLEVRPKPVRDFCGGLTFLADEKNEALVYCQYYSVHNKVLKTFWEEGNT